MTELSKISFSTISYVTEDLNKVLDALKHCFPEKLRDTKFNTQKIQSQFGDQIIIVSCEFKGDSVSEIISYLSNLLDSKDKKFIGSMLTHKIDFDERLLHLRINKFLPLSNIIQISDGSDVIKVEIKYQVFTAQQNNLENIRNSLMEIGIIEA